MEGTRNKPRCRPGLWPPIDVRRPSKEVGKRAGRRRTRQSYYYLDFTVKETRAQRQLLGVR